MAATPTSVVRVTWWRTDAVEATALERFRAWLSPGEATRYAQFLQARHRATFLASRILLRHELGTAAGHPPRALRFSTDVHGVKPRVVAPEDAAAWHFSLTHTDGLVACAVTTAGDLGLDAEGLRRVARIDALIPRVLSPAECEAFAHLEGDARRRRFFEVWCLKEAWLKAEGIGLRVPLTTIDVTFSASDVRVGDGVRATRLIDVAPGFVMALAHPPGVSSEEIEVRPFDWAAVMASCGPGDGCDAP